MGEDQGFSSENAPLYSMFCIVTDSFLKLGVPISYPEHLLKTHVARTWEAVDPGGLTCIAVSVHY